MTPRCQSAQKRASVCENALFSSLPTRERLRQGRYEEAVDFLSKSPQLSSGSSFALRFVMMLELDGTSDRTLTELRRVSQRGRSGYDYIFELWLWFYCGATEEGMNRARAIRAGGWRPPPDRTEWHRAALDYLCGDGSVAKLFELARGSVSREAWSHWLAGHIKLSHKEFGAAATHFREYCRTGALMQTVIHWPPIWAERLEKDPTWPPWIKSTK